jgi:hypothetical protein
LNEIIYRDGVAWIDAKTDSAFRKALLAGVPACLTPKMRAALSRHPHANAAEYSLNYFGTEKLEEIRKAVTPLVTELEDYLEFKHRLAGLSQWLSATGYASDYKLILVFAEWASMKRGQ